MAVFLHAGLHQPGLADVVRETKRGAHVECCVGAAARERYARECTLIFTDGVVCARFASL